MILPGVTPDVEWHVEEQAVGIYGTVCRNPYINMKSVQYCAHVYINLNRSKYVCDLYC